MSKDPEELPVHETITVQMLDPDTDEVLYKADIDMETWERFAGDAARAGIPIEEYINMKLDEWLKSEGY